MKNILLLGVSRTGKSTLTKRLLEKYPKYNVLGLDCIINASVEVFPEINLGYVFDGVKGDKLAKYVGSLLENQSHDYKGICYIIEGDSILPDNIEGNFDLDKTLVLFFGHNKLTVNKIVNNCRKFDTPSDWSSKCEDEFLIKHSEFHLELGKDIEKQCKNYGFKFIDTSFNRDEVLNEAFEYIVKEL